MAGTAFADTNETASTLGTPVAPTASIRRALASTGSGASACRPSLGPTSRMTTRRGSGIALTAPVRAPREPPVAASPAPPQRLALVVERGDPLAAVLAR